MAESINGFFGKYRWLSNFEMATVELDGIEYPSTEHAYQAAKSTDPAERRRIRLAEKPAEAKRLGKPEIMQHKRADWQSVSLSVMEDLCRQKFTKHQDLKKKLLDTGDAYLEETNTWGDVFYGVCKGKGENHLGKILMKIRSELQHAS